MRPVRKRRRAGKEHAALPIVILGVSLLLGSAAASMATIYFHRSSDLLAAAPIGPASNAVVFVIDGASPADLVAASTPNILYLERAGVTYDNAWVGQLRNVGPASNATISTGAFPAQNGITGTEWRNPKTGSLERPTSPSQVQLGALDQAMEASNATPLAALLKDHFRGARILSAGGAGCANADAAGSWLADYVICPVRRGSEWRPGAVTGHAAPASIITDHSLFQTVAKAKAAPGEAGWTLGQQDDWITRYAMKVMRKTRPVLTVINFPELGLIGKHAPGQGQVKTVVSGIDADIGRVVGQLKREHLLSRTAFVVTSDQAMSTLAVRTPSRVLHRAVVAAGGGTVYMDTGQTAMVGLQDTLQGPPVAQAIHDEHVRGVDALYYKMRSGNAWSYEPQYLDPDLLPSFARALQYELGTMASQTSPDVVVVGSPHTGIVPGLSSGQAPLASGLGAQWDTQHVPLIVAGHGVVSGVTSDFPARLVDVAPTVAALMGLASPKGNGAVLADAMVQPTDGQKSYQNRARPRLELYEKALRARVQQSKP